MKFAVTIGKNGGNELPEKAKAWADLLHVPYVVRPSKGTLQDLLEEKQLDCLLVATKKGAQIVSALGPLFYHPGMAVLRIDKLQKGERDNFVEACELKENGRLLDCTLGLAADSAVASFVVGAKGKVVGLEASLPLAFMLKEELKKYAGENPELNKALERITVINMEASEYLKDLTPDAFDVVYFDPMFRHPVDDSSSMKPLRPIAWEKPLARELLQAALRVAPLVVVKERSLTVFNDLGITELKGGKYSKIKYGILRR